MHWGFDRDQNSEGGEVGRVSVRNPFQGQPNIQGREGIEEGKALLGKHWSMGE